MPVLLARGDIRIGGLAFSFPGPEPSIKVPMIKGVPFATVGNADSPSRNRIKLVLDNSQVKSRNAHVLVVDDNPAVLKLMATLFEEEGLTVRLANSAAAARTLLDTPCESFDLVLSDIQMPRETGFDLLKWIKRDGSRHADLPVLLTTAELPEAENRLKGLAMGAVDYVVRPIELRELVLRVINAIEHFQRVKDLETSLQDSQNLAMVGRLMAASNHEIRNIAALVHMCAHQLRRTLAGGANTDENISKAMDALTEASSLLSDIVRGVSSVLSSDPLELQTVDIKAEVERLMPVLKARVKPFFISLHGDDRQCWAHADALRVKQILINMVLNAADSIKEYAPIEGGRISVHIDRQDRTLRLRVVDNGIGLSTASERRDFQAFATTKKLRGGQGLGLWFSSRLATSMNGALSLTSGGVGMGATATLTLAAAEPPTDDAMVDEVNKYLAELDDEGGI